MMLKRFCAAMTSALLMMTAVAGDFVIPREIHPAKWNTEVTGNGELCIKVGENCYRWSSQYSYPNMPADGWLKVPGVEVKITRDGANCTVTYEGKFYTLRREIIPGETFLVMRETIRNISKEDLAVAYDHTLLSQTPVPLKKVLIGGASACNDPSEPDSPAHNSTLFFQGTENTLGMVIEDDYARLQNCLINEANKVQISNRSFCLAPDKEYTFSYSFYPTASGDYWDFINTVRRDWKLNHTLDGNILLATAPHKMLSDCHGDNNQIYRDLIKNYQQHLGIKYISATNGIWMGNSQLYGIPGSTSFMKAYDSEATMIERYKEAMKIAPMISTELRPYALIQTIYAGPAQMVDEKAIPFADSCIVEADGKPRQIEVTDPEGKKVLGYVRSHYPALGNSYFDYLKHLVAVTQETGIKDVYFDTVTFSYWTPYGRWTYDRWDGLTCDMDKKTWTIKQKKCDLALYCADALLALFDQVEAGGGKVITNGSWIPQKMLARSSKIMNFYEGQGAQLSRARHLNQPTNLGYYPGYRNLEPWDDTPKMFANVLENLDWGLLTYVYWPTPKPIEQPTICRHLFPITIKNIYSGCVEGEDRIITRHSGQYSLGTAERPKVFIYDENGVEHVAQPAEAKFSLKDGESRVKVTVPEGGAAVIITGESVKDTLKRELLQ